MRILQFTPSVFRPRGGVRVEGRENGAPIASFMTHPSVEHQRLLAELTCMDRGPPTDVIPVLTMP